LSQHLDRLTGCANGQAWSEAAAGCRDAVLGAAGDRDRDDSLRRRAGLISLPALGLGQVHAARAAALGLVEGLAIALVDDRSRPREERVGRLVESAAPVHRVVDSADDGEIGFVSSRITGRLRLLAGMVRANRPGRALLGLSKLLVGAFGTAAFALTTNTIWQRVTPWTARGSR
jgi:hypothetical protein